VPATERFAEAADPSHTDAPGEPGPRVRRSDGAARPPTLADSPVCFTRATKAPLNNIPTRHLATLEGRRRNETTPLRQPSASLAIVLDRPDRAEVQPATVLQQR
jgi:hypothetical protein